MRRKMVPEGAIEEVISRFTEVGLVNDRELASGLVANQLRHRTSARFLRQKLRQKGVEADIIEEATADLDPDVELEVARALVRKRLPALSGVDRNTRYRRLAGQLSRRGFAPSVVARAIREGDADDSGEAWPTGG